MSDNTKKPLGESIRDFINPALEDTRRQEVQNNILNDMLEDIVNFFEIEMARKFQRAFNNVAARSERRPELKNPMILEELTTVDPMTGEAKYSPVLRIQIPIATGFTQFSPDDIKDQPNYIKLHEKAQKMDVAVRVIGLTADESKSPSGFSFPPILIIDGSKTYAEGALENPSLYPNLPPKNPEIDKRSGQEFKF